MTVTRLIYISENQIDPAQGSVVRQLGGILRSSKRNNERLGITGALVFDDMWFLQALEGDRRAIWRQFEHISHDERHTNIRMIEMREAERRIFGNWWMGLATRNATTEHLFKPFTTNGRLMADDLGASTILALMVALSEHSLSRDLSRAQAGVAPGVAA